MNDEPQTVWLVHRWEWGGWEDYRSVVAVCSTEEKATEIMRLIEGCQVKSLKMDEVLVDLSDQFPVINKGHARKEPKSD